MIVHCTVELKYSVAEIADYNIVGRFSFVAATNRILIYKYFAIIEARTQFGFSTFELKKC